MKRFGSLFYKPTKNPNAPVVKRWAIWPILKKIAARTCMAIGAMVLLSAIMTSIIAVRMGGAKAPVLPDDMILVLQLDHSISETQVRPTFLDPFPFLQPTLGHIIKVIEKAKDDERVHGIVFNMKGSSINLAHIEELRQALQNFRTSGKSAKMYSSSYTDTSGGLSSYYLASIFDEIWMQPVGMFSISGLSMEMPFASGAMDKIGVKAQFLQREEYKSAMENFTHSEMTPANKQALTELMSSLNATMIKAITQEQKISEQQLKNYIDKGLLTGDEALKAGLIDRLDYGDVLVADWREKISGEREDESVELIDFGDYYMAAGSKGAVTDNKTAVALIYAVGTIVDQAGSDGNVGADELSSAIEEAYHDEAIEAIVLRVDSPGGSPTASETIRRSLVKAKEKGKKVVVSMGPVAASGGYWIATDADKIVANAGTITGSIGVIMGKFEASQLFDRLGINWQGPQYGENADLWALHKPFDDKAQERLNVLIDDSYQAFLQRVANGRQMSVEKARSLAKGKAWSGVDALQVGLIDRIGTLNDAFDETAVLLGHTNRQDLNIIRFPADKKGYELLLEMFGQNVSSGNFLSSYMLQNFLGLSTEDIKALQAYQTQRVLLSQGGHTSVYAPELETLR